MRTGSKMLTFGLFRWAVLPIAFLAITAASAEAAHFDGTQTGPNEWTYTLTFDPMDNYAICPLGGGVATITLSGLQGVVSATAPTSTDLLGGGLEDALEWVPVVSDGGTVVTWTNFGPGTGNFSTERHTFGFKVFTATPAANGTVNVASDGISLDSLVCPLPPGSERDFAHTTNGPAGEPDGDGDGFPDDGDNCPLVSNPDQADGDSDEIGDACDDCPADAANDADTDGICEVDDNCDTVSNTNQSDADNDGTGDACEADADNDSVIDDNDNCPLDPNSDQADSDHDGVGDVCDADFDGDGVLDAEDVCLGTPAGAPVLANGCSVDQQCACDTAWKNHGAYVSCVSHAAGQLFAAGSITEAEMGAIVSGAGQSSCGAK